MRTFFTLLEGVRFEFFDTGEPIPASAIVRGIGREQRFARQTSEYWPVACHLVVTMGILEQLGEGRLVVVAGGVHDVEEALLGDVPTPLKAILRVALPGGEVVGYEEGIGRPTRVKCVEALKLPPNIIDLCEGPAVKRADRIALHAEGAVLHPKILRDLGELPEEDRDLCRAAEAGVRGVLATVKANRGDATKLWQAKLREVRRG